jgi:hypothetical protein
MEEGNGMDFYTIFVRRLNTSLEDLFSEKQEGIASHMNKMISKGGHPL